jgi:hypothetical protein
MKRLPGYVLLVVLSLAGSACGGEEEAEIEPAAEPGAMDGLTPEQIRSQAEPMSPAVAESLGIVDTTIHIEDPYPGDTVIDSIGLGGTPRTP